VAVVAENLFVALILDVTFVAGWYMLIASWGNGTISPIVVRMLAELTALGRRRRNLDVFRGLVFIGIQGGGSLCLRRDCRVPAERVAPQESAGLCL
jgi:hypothetical protein